MLSLGVLYVFAVLPVAVVWGLWLALPVSVASMLAFNWFFLPPVHTFTLADSENWFALAVYLATAVVVSELAARARRRAASAEQRERESALLAQLATELLGGRELNDELDQVASRAAQVLGVPEATIELGPPRRPPAGASPHPLEAADRAVGTIYVPEGSDPHVAARHRFLPALAALLAVAVERDRLEKEALEAEALRRSDLVKTALLRAVSHDLRSPLTGIRTAVGALQNATLQLSPEDRDELLETIDVDSERLSRLVGDLLDLSRLEAGGAAPAPEVWALDDLVHEAVDLLGARDRVEVAGEAPLVNVDATQIQRVLANLIENALKFSPEGAKVHVRITATRMEAIVRVVDQGPGLAEDELERVFEPFYRRETASSAGAGLGLAIARGFAAANGGRVWAESRPGPGRVVRARAPGRRGAGGAAGVSSNGQRVLVVDDEPQILRALRATLRGAGYTVDSAATAEEALTAAAAHPPEAVILDLVLPDGSGTDVCRELRSWSDAPVIVLSAVGEEREKIAALDAGADDYVTKPFSVDELLARLRAVLRRRSGLGPEPVIEVGDLRIDVAERTVTSGGERVKLSAARVRPPARARAEPRQAADAPCAAPRGVGSRVRGRGALPPRLRLASPPQDRAGPVAAALPAHRGGSGLSPRRSRSQES